jgi:hypothetical protein
MHFNGFGEKSVSNYVHVIMVSDLLAVLYSVNSGSSSGPIYTVRH